jgi:hypothetical protein
MTNVKISFFKKPPFKWGYILENYIFNNMQNYNIAPVKWGFQQKADTK